MASTRAYYDCPEFTLPHRMARSSALREITHHSPRAFTLCADTEMSARRELFIDSARAAAEPEQFTQARFAAHFECECELLLTQPRLPMPWPTSIVSAWSEARAHGLVPRAPQPCEYPGCPTTDHEFQYVLSRERTLYYCNTAHAVQMWAVHNIALPMQTTPQNTAAAKCGHPGCENTQNLTLCGRCQRISYCSEAHRDIDKKSHRDECTQRHSL